jgi:dTDP-4-dehydrorhamnose reductase
VKDVNAATLDMTAAKPSPAHILVTGASGQLGSELLRRASRFHVTADGLSSKQLDISDARAVRSAVMNSGAGVIVNAAAYTAVDKAETETERAFAVNRDGTAHLAAACAEADIPFIHVSTDYVFDGSKATPYTEDDPVRPVSVYGASKEAGEQALRAAWPRHVILRTAWVHSAFGNNFVKTMLRLARERDSLRVVADQRGCPTAAGDLAEAILSIAGRISREGDIPWGTYHYCGAGSTTWHGFAEAIVHLAAPALGREVPVIPIATADYPTPAKRPANSVLDCTKIRERLGIQPRPWRESLQEVIVELLGTSS